MQRKLLPIIPLLFSCMSSLVLLSLTLLLCFYTPQVSRGILFEVLPNTSWSCRC